MSYTMKLPKTVINDIYMIEGVNMGFYNIQYQLRDNTPNQRYGNV